jgi:hypothetical protein
MSVAESPSAAGLCISDHMADASVYIIPFKTVAHMEQDFLLFSFQGKYDYPNLETSKNLLGVYFRR